MRPLDRKQVSQLLKEVTSNTGMQFGIRQVDQLMETVTRSVKNSGCRDVQEFRKLINSSSKAYEDFVGELTVGETYFFRDQAQFDVIRDQILPEIRKRRGAHSLPQLWSAGCSTGEEPYTLAILLYETNPEGKENIIATDLSRQALKRAREARYRKWSLRGEARQLLKPYLTEEDGEFLLSPCIKQRVKFGYLNLVEDEYPSRASGIWEIDLILCRNVLIYFDQETMQRVVSRFRDSLVPGGWLVLGASDPQATEFTDLEAVRTPAGSVYRRLMNRQSSISGLPPESPTLGNSASTSSSALIVPHEFRTERPRNFSSGKTSEPSSASSSAPNPSSDRNPSTLALAEQALVQKDLERAIELAQDLLDSEEGAVIYMRALTLSETEQAEAVCAELLEQHRLSAPLHYLHAIQLMHLERQEEALGELRRTLFLDRTLVIAHFMRGTLLKNLGRMDEARRAFRNARDHCASLSDDTELVLGEGETAGCLRRAAEQQLSLLGESQDA